MPVGVLGLLNVSRCDSSSTDTGVLVVIAGHDPTLQEGG
ncbi:hypothetical protein AVEN_102112-1, partial [Araneus ventricosus]